MIDSDDPDDQNDGLDLERKSMVLATPNSQASKIKLMPKGIV